MSLRVVSNKHLRQDKNCFRTHVPGQLVGGVGLGKRRGRRGDRTGADTHPGGYSFAEKNGESEAARLAMAAAQCFATQLLITWDPILLSDAGGRALVHRSFF